MAIERFLHWRFRANRHLGIACTPISTCNAFICDSKRLKMQERSLPREHRRHEALRADAKGLVQWLHFWESSRLLLMLIAWLDGLDGLKFAEKKPEARYDEPKSHQGNAGTDPRQECPVLGQIGWQVAAIDILTRHGNISLGRDISNVKPAGWREARQSRCSDFPTRHLFPPSAS